MSDTATCRSTEDRPARHAELVELVGAGRLDRARNALASLDQSQLAELAQDPQGRQAAVKVYLIDEQWDRVARLLSQAERLDTAGQLTRNLARNMAALRQHRPAVYPLLRITGTGRYQFVQAAAQAPPTIADTRHGERPLLLSAGPNPVEAARQAMGQIHTPPHIGAPVGLLGIGDGYVLSALARHPPTLFMDQQQVVHVIEPDAELVQACLMLHDLTGEHGPIEQLRFQWHVGENWRESLSEAILNDLQLPPPVRQVRQGTQTDAIAREISALLGQLAGHQTQWQRELEAYYAGIDEQQWTVLFSDDPPRRPRVLLLTTRFSTVLQYATRDTAEGFRRNGWEAKVVIEKSPYHRHFPHSIRDELLRFKPDLVFQIDHLRHEQGDVIPSHVPFACWVQDLLPNLTNREAGGKVGSRDFVLAFNTPSFIEDYGYPPRQCIDMPMMLTLPPEAEAAAQDRRNQTEHEVLDFVYVSNVSQQPRQAATELLTTRVDAAYRPMMRSCFDKMLAHYETGGSYPSHQDLYQLFERHLESARLSVDEQTYTLLTSILWNPMNIALYRQQALRWVARLAEERGWSLGLYGRGWETHPHFRPFARGVVEHGPALRDLTRRTRINLNLEPYPCFTHHRLLDGLCAGGFFLIRRHPANTLLQQLSNFLDDHLPADVETTQAAHATVASSKRAEFKRLVASASCLSFSRRDDPVRQVRCWQRAGVLIRQDDALPLLEDVSFDDPVSLASLIERYLNDADARQDISKRQRQSIETRLTFPVAMKRVVGEIGKRLRG